MANLRGFPVLATVTRVAANASSVQLLAANPDRQAVTIVNNSASQKLYVKFGTTAALTSGSEDFSLILQPEGSVTLEGTDYTGRIDGIWGGADASGEALITETVMSTASL